MKIVLIVGGVIIGAGAVGGIAAGVVASRQAETSESIKQVEPPKDSNQSGNGMQGDDSSVITTPDLDTVIKSITNENIVVVEKKDAQEEKAKKDYYAFNLKDENLKVSSKANIPNNFEVELKIEKNKTTFEDLNKGILEVTVTVKDKQAPSSTKTETKKLDGFKSGDEFLLKLLEAQEDESDETAVSQTLVITPKTENASMFVTVEQLNKQSTEEQRTTKQNGLTEWLNKSTKNVREEYLKGVSLEGTVKLTKIEKDNKDVTYFTLASANDQNYIKLVKTEGMTKKEAIVGEIKTINLLATSVSVVPTEIDTDATKMLMKTLSEEKTMNKKFETSNDDETLGRVLSVNVPKDPAMGQEKTQVFVKAYSVKTAGMGESTDINLELNISFGSGSFITTYKTSDLTQAKELQDAGFSFHLYSKQLEKAGKDTRADDLAKDTLKVGAYLKTENITKPANKPTMMGKDGNGFDVSGPFTENLDNSFKVKVEQTNYEKGVIVFADYSYPTGTEESSPLKDKVLFAPDLTLIDLVTTEKV